jgi:hypothetical protein
MTNPNDLFVVIFAQAFSKKRTKVTEDGGSKTFNSFVSFAPSW